MSVENNCTLTFKWPLPKAAIKPMNKIVADHEFSEDWDSDVVDLTTYDPRLKTPTVVLQVLLCGRNVPIEAHGEILALAEKHKFSVKLHTEWWRDYESEVTGALMAYDSVDDRKIDCWATNNTGEPLISLQEALRYPSDQLRKMYSMPKDLI